MARAALQTSAPCASTFTSEKPLTMRPDAMMRTRSRTPAPASRLRQIQSPSASGMPTLFENSGGAAPVPPSPPSTVTKSG